MVMQMVSTSFAPLLDLFKFEEAVEQLASSWFQT